MEKYLIIGGSIDQQSDIAIHLAQKFAENQKTVIVNFWHGRRVLEEQCDLLEVVYDIYDFLTETCSLEQLLMESDHTEQLFLAASSFNENKNELSEKNILQLNKMDIPIQIFLSGEKETEIALLKYWVNAVIHLDDKNIEEGEFYFQKKKGEKGIYLGPYPEKQEDEYWHFIQTALTERKDLDMKKSIWQRIKEIFR